MKYLKLPVVALLFASINSIHSEAGASGDATIAQSEDPDDSNELISRYFAEMSSKRFQEALKTAGAFELDAGNRKGRAIQSVLRGAALVGLKRDAEAQRKFEEAEQLDPHSADVSHVGLDAILATERLDFAVTFFDQLIARAPDLVRGLPPETVYYLLSNEPKDQMRRNDDRRIALARLGYGGDEGDYLTGQAVSILVGRGEVLNAAELVRYLDDPQTIEDLLIQKRNASIWPALELVAGTKLEKARSASVRVAENAFNASPADNEKLQTLINALRHSGRHLDAIAFRAKLPMTLQAMGQADEQMGWAVNNVALALHELGRTDEADQLFAMLNEAQMPEGSGRWRVSMIINRLEFLVADGKFQQAMALMETSEQSARDNGNSYAQQLVRRLKFCALSGLGRGAEVAALRPELLSHAKDAFHATVEGLLCADDVDGAEKLVLEGLRDEATAKRFEAQFVRSLQPRPLTSDDPSVWQGRWTALRQRAAIAEAYQRRGRDMPEQFLPPPIN